MAIIDLVTSVPATHMVELPVEPPEEPGQCRCYMWVNVDHNKKYCTWNLTVVMG